MKYCPNCKRDFEDGVLFCRFCEVDTVDSLDTAADTPKAENEESPAVTAGAETCIWTTYDVLSIPKIEEALKAAGIPVEVRQSETRLEDEDEETEDIPDAAEEQAEETVDEKKGFFARLFNKKPQDAPERRVVGERPNAYFHKDPNRRVVPVFDDELFDILVPEESAEKAEAVLQNVFGVVGAEDYGIDNGAADGEETEEV